MKFAAVLAATLVWGAAAEPVRLHPVNPRYFLYQGKPTVFVTSAEHYGAVLNLDFDYRKYLATLEKDGLNYTRIFSGAYYEPPGAFNIERNTLAPQPDRLLTPWPRVDGRFDLTGWNEAYFARLKDFLAEAGRRGVVVELTLFCSTYADRQWNISPWNMANNGGRTRLTDWKKLHTLENGEVLPHQEALVRKLVRELNSFDNLVFEIQNEPWADRTVVAEILNPYLPRRWPNTADLADDRSLAWQARVAQWITTEEAQLPQRHLIAQNVCNFRYPARAPVPGAAILNFHYAWPEAGLWNQHLKTPIGCDETGFAGTEDDHYRIQAWRFMLAGGALFNHLDYSFSVGFEDGTDVQPKSPGGGSPALRRQLRVLRRFLEALPFVEMAPDLTVVRAAPGAWVQAFSKPGVAYAFHVTTAGDSTLALAVPPARWEAEWTDPRTGAMIKRESLEARSGILTLAVPAGLSEAALLLTR